MSVISADPVPVDLARGSFAAVDTVVAMEKVNTLSNGGGYSNRPQEYDNIPVSATSISFNNDSVANKPSGETLLNSSGPNSSLESCTQISDNFDSVLFDTECKIPNPSQIAAEETHNRLIADEPSAPGCENACFSLLPEPASRGNSLSEDLEPVDLRRLGSILWPKSTFTMSDVTCESFTTLAADHESYCMENMENVSGRKAFLSSCCETGTKQEIYEADWSNVSRWLKESNRQFNRQLPECSALIYGLPASEEKLRVDSDKTSEKPRTTVDEKEEDNSVVISSTDANPRIVSSESLITSSSNSVSECSNRLPSPAVLSREKILSLQYCRATLNPEVISRINELKLRRTGGVLRPLDSRTETRNLSSSKRPESNYSSITAVTKSASQVTEVSSNSTRTKGAYKEQPASKLDSNSAKGADTAAGSCNLTEPCAASVQHHTLSPFNLESDNSTDVVVSGIVQADLSGHTTLQSMAAQSYTVATVSTPSVVSHQTGTSIANVTSSKEKPANKLRSTVETIQEGPLKMCSNGAVRLSSSAVLCTGMSTATANVSAITCPKFSDPHMTSEVFPHMASPTVSDRLPCKKDNMKVTDVAETLADHNYHRKIVNSSLQQQVPQSIRSSTNKDRQRERERTFTERRRHRLKEDSRYTEESYSEGSMFSPLAGVSTPQSRAESQCPKCSHRGRVKTSRVYDQSSNNAHSYKHHASRYKVPYDHYGTYGPYMSDIAPSVLASVSYSSYYLGAYDAHVRSMHYYNMLSQQTTANLWQQQAEYIRRMAKYYANS